MRKQSTIFTVSEPRLTCKIVGSLTVVFAVVNFSDNAFMTLEFICANNDWSWNILPISKQIFKVRVTNSIKIKTTWKGVRSLINWEISIHKRPFSIQF